MNEEFTMSFGSTESPKDDRTISADMLATATSELPPEKYIIPLDFFPVNELSDQRKVGMCTQCSARMGSEEANRDGVKTSDAWGYLMQKYFYDDVSFGYHFEGSSIFTALRTRKNYGAPSIEMEEKYPLKRDGSYADFIADWKARYGGKIPQEILEDASKHKIKGYYSVPVNPVSIAKEVSNNRVVMIRLTVGENTYKARDGRVSWDERDLMPLRKPQFIEGGHAMAVNEYSGLTIDQLLTGPNSWSRRWGKNGYFYFFFKEQIGYFTEAWAIMDDETKFVFKNVIKKGMKNADVVALQKVLEKEGLLTMPKGVAYGYFGDLTFKAVKAYQEKYREDILLPVGLSLPTGFVGAQTLKKLNS